MPSDQPVGEAGRKARTARADARAVELAPIIAEDTDGGGNDAERHHGGT